jgi:hypothetical protein
MGELNPTTNAKERWPIQVLSFHIGFDIKDSLGVWSLMSKFKVRKNNLPSVVFLLAFLSLPPYNLGKFCCQYFKDIVLEEA